MKQISIIIPVYNAESTIENTLESLLQQTYKNIEIICVDDGSSDDSLQVLNNYSNTYPEIIKVIHQENKGVSVARNTGIDTANGEILMFVDADDELIPHACQRVNEIFSKTDPEVFTFGFRCEPESAMPLGMSKELKPPEKRYSHFHPDLLFKDKSRPYICRTAVASQLLKRENIKFEPNIALGEDQIIYFLLYPLAKRVVLSPDQLYVYNMNIESATHSNALSEEGNLKRLEQHLSVVETILHEWKKRKLGAQYSAQLLDWLLDFVMFDINSLPDNLSKQYFSRLEKALRDYFCVPPSSLAKSWSTRKCLEQIEQISKHSDQGIINSHRVNLIYMALFYCRRYGFIRCFQQVLIGLGILKKWR